MGCYRWLKEISEGRGFHMPYGVIRVGRRLGHKGGQGPIVELLEAL